MARHVIELSSIRPVMHVKEALRLCSELGCHQRLAISLHGKRHPK